VEDEVYEAEHHFGVGVSDCVGRFRSALSHHFLHGERHGVQNLAGLSVCFRSPLVCPCVTIFLSSFLHPSWFLHCYSG